MARATRGERLRTLARRHRRALGGRRVRARGGATAARRACAGFPRAAASPLGVARTRRTRRSSWPSRSTDMRHAGAGHDRRAARQRGHGGGTAARAGRSRALPTRVVGVRVVPRLVANRARVLRLARRTRRAARAAVRRSASPPLDRRLAWRSTSRRIGGAYGRESAAGRAAAAALRRRRRTARSTRRTARRPSRSRSQRARRAPDERILFWLTFDGRWLARHPTIGDRDTTQ